MESREKLRSRSRPAIEAQPPDAFVSETLILQYCRPVSPHSTSTIDPFALDLSQLISNLSRPTLSSAALRLTVARTACSRAGVAATRAAEWRSKDARARVVPCRSVQGCDDAAAEVAERLWRRSSYSESGQCCEEGAERRRQSARQSASVILGHTYAVNWWGG